MYARMYLYRFANESKSEPVLEFLLSKRENLRNYLRIPTMSKCVFRTVPTRTSRRFKFVHFYYSHYLLRYSLIASAQFTFNNNKRNFHISAEQNWMPYFTVKKTASKAIHSVDNVPNRPFATISMNIELRIKFPLLLQPLQNRL